MYSAYKIRIKKGHRLHGYFTGLCQNSKNLYNATQFHVRQVYTALRSEKPLHPLQKEVLETIESNMGKMNEIRQKSYANKVKKGSKTTLSLFVMPTKEKPNVGYNFLDAFFKCSKNVDYFRLPSQVNQQAMKLVFQDWKSYFQSMKEYKIHPEKFTGKPKMPTYKKKEQMICILTNQVCKIYQGDFLQFPGTKTKLNIGKIGAKGKLQQVRILPNGEHFILEVVMDEVPLSNAILREELNDYSLIHEPKRISSADLGVNVLAAVTDNTGLPPILIKGETLKSINQWYNKQNALLFAALRNGKNEKQGAFTSKRLEKLADKRNRKVDDFLHKASANYVRIAMERNIDTIVFGKNDGWKQEVTLRKKDTQNFVQIPHARFISMVKYKAERLGIQVIVQEESYTSKACFLSCDAIPIYGEERKEKAIFSGYRKERSWYKVKSSKIIWHADLNGSANILVKAFPNAFDELDRDSLLQNPLVLNVS